jgi:hypothetical protein
MTTNKPPIVLIHGLWMAPLSWEHWVEHYSAKGYPIIARSWPGLEGDIEDLRRDPSPIAKLGITEIVKLAWAEAHTREGSMTTAS